ncbi:type II toxin-antitoxin system VapC family toxin [Microcoleus sp. B4-D4]|uniref:type II toxin-antitoxin system VapC family toxin n=1 Tax=Microcoleus sp. B4-D4 TaxID=2818667 RepID=UPI002FD76734
MVNAYFLDTSALVKRYVPEFGSNWIQSITLPVAGNFLAISQITWVEVCSAFSRRQREGSLSFDEVNQLMGDFLTDFDNQYEVLEVDRTLIETAGELVRQNPLRAYDSVQLASALRVQSTLVSFFVPDTQLVFVSADKRLLDIAHSEGLAIDNPNNYP